MKCDLKTELWFSCTVLWLLAGTSGQRLESPDGLCEEGYVRKKHSHCPFYLEQKEHLDFLNRNGGAAEYDTLLTTLKYMVCN